MQAGRGAVTSVQLRVAGYALAAAAGCLWASLVVLGKLLVATGVDPVVLVGLRATTAFLLLAGVLALADRRLIRLRLADVPLFAAYGACLALNYALYFHAFKWTTGTVAVILMGTYPLFVALLAGLALGERLDPPKALALGLSLVGCFLVAQGYSREALLFNSRGVLSGLGAAVAFALHSVIAKKATTRYNSWTVALWGFGFAALFLLASRGAAVASAGTLPPAVWEGILVLALFPTLLAYAAYTRALACIEAGRASITSSIEPVMGAAAAWFFLGERLEALQWVGAAVVIGAVALLQVADLRRSAGPRQPA